MLQANKLLIVLFSGLCLSSCSGGKPAKQAPPPERMVSVKVKAASMQAISRFLETAGELKADKEVKVSAEKAGQIQRIFVKEGSWVYEGQAIVRVEGDGAQAELDLARSNYESYQSLYEEGAVSRMELKSYETLYKAAKSQVDNLDLQASISGKVGEIYVDVGDFVNIGSPIMELVRIRPLRVSYNIPEKAIPYIKVGQEVSISTDAYPGKSFKALIDFVSPRVDTTSRSILVRAKVLDPGSELKANQFVNIRQEIIKKQSLVVPEESIYLDQGQEYVYLANVIASDNEAISNNGIASSQAPRNDTTTPGNDTRAARVAVKTGLRQKGVVEITDGLSNGELVVYAGLHSIFPGAKLMIVNQQDIEPKHD